MRTFFAQVETRYRAIKNCPFTPAHVVKVFVGYMCFESDNDYIVWRNQLYELIIAGFLLFRTILYRNGVWHDNSGGATIY